MEIKNEEIPWTVSEDEYGTYRTRTNEQGIVEKLTTYKQKWYDENPPVEPEAQPPSPEEQLAERLTLQEQVLEELMFIILPEITGGGSK